jgi:hypothetical protein
MCSRRAKPSRQGSDDCGPRGRGPSKTTMPASPSLEEPALISPYCRPITLFLEGPAPAGPQPRTLRIYSGRAEPIPPKRQMTVANLSGGTSSAGPQRVYLGSPVDGQEPIPPKIPADSPLWRDQLLLVRNRGRRHRPAGAGPSKVGCILETCSPPTPRCGN